MSPGAALAPDAAMALGIASTAMPFARTPEDEAERWLRVLLMHGEAGVALHALGVSEGALPASGVDQGTPLRASDESPAPDRSARAAVDARDPVARVTECAYDVARRRGTGGIDTNDLLVAVMHIYGTDFDRVLRTHGTDRGKVLERLAAAHHPAPT